jgi:heme-degrading monooxygenase HmoA
LLKNSRLFNNLLKRRQQVFILMSIHHPKPGYESALVDSMHRYGASIKGQPGLRGIHTLKDQGSDRLVGLAVFESEADFERLAPLARAAVKDDPFEVWERVEIDGLRLIEV